jgi:hypothetical protein
MFAERLIHDGLEAGKVRWKAKFMRGFVLTPKGQKVRAPGASFWQEPVHVDWTENWAQPLGYFSQVALNVTVSREDLLALLPPSESTDNENEATTASGWITAEVRRMKAARKIPEGIKISVLAEQLRQQMHKAAKGGSTIHPVGRRYIESLLHALGLWPLSSIK